MAPELHDAMGAFPALPLGRRPIRCRCLVVYRLSPGAVRELLPPGLQPRTLQGFAIGTACFTRLGPAPLFRLHERRGGGSDHLSYRIAVQRENGSEATWIARRETSSWLEARCGSKLRRGDYGRSSFRVKEDAFAIELEVEGEHGEAFYLRGEAAGAVPNALFASSQALESFLGEERLIQPYDLFAPEADELDLAEHFAPEPLAVFEARAGFFAEGPFARERAELDSAWRIVNRRLVGVAERRPSFRVLPDSGSSIPALPTT
jgi:hypothetical protein